MPACPHCGQEIGPTEPPTVPWWRLDRSPHNVNIGCGSLILIAIIVAFCSGGGGMSGKIDRLDADIHELGTKIDKLDRDVRQIGKKP